MKISNPLQNRRSLRELVKESPPFLIVVMIILLIVLLGGCKTLETTASSEPQVKWASHGKTVDVKQTIVVGSGETLDGRLPDGSLTRVIAPRLGDGGQSEGQKPVFKVMPGGTLKNFILDFPAADGVHLYTEKGRTTRAENIQVKDVGEDAITVKRGDGKALITGCIFQYATDKVIQVNCEAEVVIRDCVARKFGKFARSNGDPSTDLPYDVTMERPVAIEGHDVLRMSNSRARGKIIKPVAWKVSHIANASGGAKIEVVP